MKRLLSLILTFAMLATMYPAGVVISSAATETISDEDLFLKYPKYLSNSMMDDGLQMASDAYYAVISSYSETDQFVASVMSAMSQGISVHIKDKLGEHGLGETLYEEYARKAATKYMQNAMLNDSTVQKATKHVDSAYSLLKNSFEFGSSLDKNQLLEELRIIATDYDINVTASDMDDIVNELYDCGTLESDLKIIGLANDMWKFVLEFTEMHAIEMTTIDFLMDELAATGQSDSDLYLGLSLIKKDIDGGEAKYVLKNFVNSQVIGYVADNIDDWIFKLAGSSTLPIQLATAFCKIYADYIYANAKADEISQAIMQTSFINSLDVCLSTYRIKFLNKQGTSDDIVAYESLYGAYLSAYVTALDACQDISKLHDKFDLGGDCGIWSENIKTLYTYDRYIEWCKDAYKHDIENSRIDESGESTITDALNEETIKARLDKFMSFKDYVPNAGNTWRGDFYTVSGSVGYMAKTFAAIFDTRIGTRVQHKYNHILTNNKNVRIVGRLEEDAVTEVALKELFANVRIGDVLLTSGQYDDIHAMIVYAVEEDGVIVYDCDSPYNPDAPKDMDICTIQMYKFKYSKMADAFSDSGKYVFVPGISVYRAIYKIDSSSSSGNLDEEEYGDIRNYVIEDGVLIRYKGSKKELEIPDGVIEIGENCFMNSGIKSVKMPASVTSIARGAFAGCRDLQYVGFSSGLCDIYSSAFQDCTSLKSMILPKGLKNIYAYAFKGSGLLYVTIPDSVETIHWYAFWQCPDLKTATIGSGVKTFYDYAVGDCPKLSKVYWNTSCYGSYGDAFRGSGSAVGGFDAIIGSNVTSIPPKAFYGSDYLRSVTIPESVTHIQSEAFAYCGLLSEVTIPKNLYQIGAYAFDYCEDLTYVYWDAASTIDCQYGAFGMGNYGEKPLEVVFSDNVERIPARLLEDASRVDSIHIGANVKYIGEHAFSYTGITELVIPDSVTTVDFGALSGCEELEELTISANMDVQDIDGMMGQPSLKNICVSDVSQYFESVDGVLYKKGRNTLCCVPGGRERLTIDKNCMTIGWTVCNDQFDNIKEFAVESGNSYFATTDGNLLNKEKTLFIKYAPKKADTEYTVPDSVYEIDERAFENCHNLTYVTIPDSVTYIGKSAFAGCDNLNTVALPDSIICISEFMFSGSGVTNLDIPNSITYIGQLAFQRCENLASISIPASVTEIHSRAFVNCKNLADVYYGASAGKWGRISISSGNEALTEAEIHFTDADDEDTPNGLMRYKYDVVSSLWYYDTVSVSTIDAGDVTYAVVYSNDYPGKYGLMDVATGELLLDNLDKIGSICEDSGLIFTNVDEKKVVYSLVDKSVVCEIANFDGLSNSSHFSEDGGFVTLASDNLLHFISRDGVVGNAVNLDHESYNDGYNHLMTWDYLGEGLYKLVAGRGNTYSQTIGAVNSDGEVVAFFDSANTFYNGYSIISVGGNYGVMDKHCNFVIPCEYTNMNRSGDNFVGQKDGIYYELDVKGNVLYTFKPDTSKYKGVDHYIGRGFATVYSMPDNSYIDRKYGIVNANNEFIIPATCSYIAAWNGFYDGLVRITVREGSYGNATHGFMDDKGKIVIPYTYDMANDFSHGLACVRMGSKYGFINTSGNVVVPLEYDWAESFSEGLAVVGKDGKYGYIDTTGNIAIPMEYDEAYSFADGKATVYKADVDKSFFINKQNEAITKSEGVYSLTDSINWEDCTYSGGVMNNATGEVVDISHFNILPVIVGAYKQYVMGFTEDMSKAYRINVEELLNPQPKKPQITEFAASGKSVSITVSDLDADNVVCVAAYGDNGKFIGIKKVVITDGCGTQIFDDDGIFAYKAFIFGSNLRPATVAKEKNTIEPSLCVN